MQQSGKKRVTDSRIIIILMLQKCSAEKNNHVFYINNVTFYNFICKGYNSWWSTIEKDKERNNIVHHLLFCSV